MPQPCASVRKPRNERVRAKFPAPLATSAQARSFDGAQIDMRRLKHRAYTLAVKSGHGSPFSKIAGESTRPRQPRSEASAARLPFVKLAVKRNTPFQRLV